jgi:hypothetical protein
MDQKPFYMFTETQSLTIELKDELIELKCNKFENEL